MENFEQKPEDTQETKKTSRRDFLKTVISTRDDPSKNINFIDSKESDPIQKPISRRDFTKVLAALLISISTEGVDALENPKEKPKEKVPNSNDSANKIFNPDKGKYLETSIESVLVLIGKELAVKVANSLGIPTTESKERFAQKLSEKPISTLFNATVGGPIFEETIMRLLPSILVGSEGNRWDAGIPSAVLFGVLHNFDKDSFGELKFNSTVPISEFMGGIFYWYLIRHRGFDHAILAHSINNTTASLILLFDNIIKNK